MVQPTSLILPLAAAVALMTAGLYACLAATFYHFRLRRGEEDEGPLLPMTLIKPVRGLDDAMEEGFRSVVASDPEGRLELLIAMESQEDPAYPVARAFASAHPGRDIQVLVTGPAGGRMGKAHNMIEALPKAKHPFVIFSDADVLATPGLLRQTSGAFRGGKDAVFGLPYHAPVPGWGGLCFQIAFNHHFCLSAALSFYLGQFRHCAGAWMAYRKEILEKAGGLGQFAHSIADDFSISSKVIASGARIGLCTETVPVRETSHGFGEAFAHLSKWAAIIRSEFPRLYLMVPVLNPGVLSALLWALCEGSGQRVFLGRGLLAAFLVSRALVGLLQDGWAGGRRLSWYQYPVLAFIDLGALAFWVAGFRSRILWRGTVYRLHRGGRAEVVAAAAR